jgi:hypothetical protein
MLVVQVDLLDAQALQAGVAGGAHVLRPAVHTEDFTRGPAHDAELGGQHHFAAARAQHLRQQTFVGAAAVHVGGIEKIHSDVERMVQHGEIGGLVGRAVEVRHAHAA